MAENGKQFLDIHKPFEAPPAPTGGLPTPEDALRNQIENQLALYQRSVEAGLERVNNTTLPWEVRMATRDTIFQMVDAPAGLGDNWGFQVMYNGLDLRKKSIDKAIAPKEAQTAMGLVREPWRMPKIITTQNVAEITGYFLDQGLNVDDAKKQTQLILGEVDQRLPEVSKELARSKDEMSLYRKIFYLGWEMRSAGSGNEVGNIYLQSKMPLLPRPKDYAHIFSSPPYFMSEKEASTIPGYPSQTEVQSLIESAGKKENAPLGEVAEHEARLLFLTALSERPELVAKWKQKTEQETLFRMYKNAGVNEAYLALKEKGINYRDSDEEVKITKVLDSLNGHQEQEIKDSWWKSLGFDNEADGIEKIGDPDLWIPMKARRGDPPVGSDKFFSGETREVRIQKIQAELEVLKGYREELSPLKNLTEDQKEVVEAKIEKCVDSLRTLQTVDSGGRLTSMFNTLALERELGLRKGATEMGCLWSVPKTTGEKEKMMERVLNQYTGGDHLAYETAKIVTEMFGVIAKHSVYAVDYDPRFAKESSGGWGSVGVEGWPYTNEFQNILAYPWYARYKLEAGGPPGSRGRFGPLMTDYLTACITKEMDENGNELFIIVDDQKKIRKGRVDEGLVIADLKSNLMETWQKGISLSNSKLWEQISDEDPFRRFLLRGFFAEGKAAIGGAGMMDIWKKREWKLDELDNDKFWDDYKLNRKVTVRDELFEEEVWADVLVDHNKNYKKRVGQVLNEVKTAEDPIQVFKRESQLYSSWKDGRKKIIYDYSDQMFWRGVGTTEFLRAVTLNEPGDFDRLKQETPSIKIERIMRRAKEASVNLVGTHNEKDLPKVMMAKKGGLFDL